MASSRSFGTTEHVANQLQPFKIIHDLAAAGALMLHVLPAGGMPNHGLVSYNPEILLDARAEQRLQDRLHDAWANPIAIAACRMTSWNS